MSAKRFLLATLAGGVTLFILGFLVYGLLLMDFFASHSNSGVMRDAPIFWALIVGQLSMAALGTIIFGRWAGISTAMGGLKAGALIGVLLGVSADFTRFATTNMMDLTAGIADIVVTTVMLAITGAVIGLVLGKIED